MPDNIPPLTDQQIREALQKQIDRTLSFGMDLLVLQNALKKKGLLTDADILQASREVGNEAKETVAMLYNATKKEPSGGIQ
jgi:hypothetical protein